MATLATQAKPAAVLWLAGFREACGLHRVVVFCANSRTLLIRIVQCFLLNGIIFLGSLFMLKSVVVPTLLWILPDQCDQLQTQHLCEHQAVMTIYSFLHYALVEIFYVLWFYPLYLFSFILSALWYNDIAKNAFDVLRSKRQTTPQVMDENKISESVDRPEGFDGIALGIGEQVYSVLLLTIFFIEVSITGYVPYLGKAINFLLLSLMYAYYCFEYKWNFSAVSLNDRLNFFESNWAFFAGFGSPCVIPIFFFSPLASYGVMAILYPLFVLTAAGTQAEQVINSLKSSHGGKLRKIPIFFFAKRLTTQVLQLFPEAHKED